MKQTKLYKVEFNSYTDSTCTTVCTNAEGISGFQYLDIPLGGLIIREDDFDYYCCFGDGFKQLTFVGTLLEPTPKTKTE